MKEPRRLLDDDPDFRTLLDAVRKDGPSGAQMGRALSTAADVARAGAPSSLASLFGRTSVKFGLGLAGVAILVGAFAVSSSRQTNDPSASHSSPIEAAPATNTASLANTPSTPEAAVASVRVDDLPAAMPATSSAVARTTSRAPSPAKDTFAEELALTGAARTALGRGDVASCLAAVERYQHEFRSGVFAQEIDVIGIEALAKSGEHERARALATRFLSTNAKSPYANRVRSVLANPEN